MASDRSADRSASGSHKPRVYPHVPRFSSQQEKLSWLMKNMSDASICDCETCDDLSSGVDSIQLRTGDLSTEPTGDLSTGDEGSSPSTSNVDSIQDPGYQPTGDPSIGCIPTTCGDHDYQPRGDPSGDVDASAVDVYDSSYTWGAYQQPIPSYQELLWSLSKLALDSYNSTHQLKFQLEHALYMEKILISGTGYSLYCHLSFIARSQDSPTKLKLFFAEVVNKAVVNICTPVEPGNPLFPLGCGRCHPEGVIYHPFEKYDVGGRRYLQSPRPPKLTEAEESAKKLLNETYILKDTVELLSPEEESELREETYCYALRALASYEHDKRCSYKLLKPLASVRFHIKEIVSALLDSSHYIHLNFEATSNDLPDASPETFFAEFNLDYSYVTTCINLTEAISTGSLNNKIESSCLVCRRHFPMYHPMGEYKGIKYQAGHQGGTLAYSQDEYRTWVAKVELQKKEEL